MEELGTPMESDRPVHGHIGHLAQMAVTKQPTVTRLLDRMEAQGHVERVSHDMRHSILMLPALTTSAQRRVSAATKSLKALPLSEGMSAPMLAQAD